MSFTEPSFFLFLLIVCTGYYLIPKAAQWVWLLAASLGFYLLACPSGFWYLLVSAFFVYSCGLLLPRLHGGWKKFFLAAALPVVLLVLLWWKYSGFLAGVAFSWGIEGLPSFSGIALPLGISFYTLQLIGYCVDVFRGSALPERNPAKFLLFVSFFPQILQGPIPRFQQLAGQLSLPHPFQWGQVRAGVQLMVWGCFQKLVIADRAGILVNFVYEHYRDLDGFRILLGILFYSFQLYTDFSGCVDIARGASQMLGIELAENFRQPYLARSVADFWKRWHISLSSWFRDYLYIPLGGNRRGKLHKYGNVIFVFLVSGLWHGAGVHFLVWGLLHGLYQAMGEILLPVRKLWLRLTAANSDCFSRHLCQSVCTFLLVSLAWVFFRAESLTQAWDMLYAMVTLWSPWVFFDGSFLQLGLGAWDFALCLLGFGLVITVDLLHQKYHLREALARQNVSFQFLVTAGGILAILLLGIYGSGYSSAGFIYAAF